MKIKIMKTKSNNLLESLHYNDVKILTNEVKETLFFNFKKEKRKNFTTSELWNIQRHHKSVSDRRFYS